jgi:hypothetical protein
MSHTTGRQRVADFDPMAVRWAGRVSLASDARGEEGPDLHGVKKSDARIASLIRDGKKGERPKFAPSLPTLTFRPWSRSYGP